MIQAQGEMLDNIEANMQDANDYMEKAEDNLENAKKLHESSRSVSINHLFSLFLENVLHNAVFNDSTVRFIVWGF